MASRLAGLLLALTACNGAAPAATTAASSEPAVAAASPTAQPTPEPTLTATTQPPTATPIPAPVNTEVSTKELAGQLQATLVAGLPPSPTPDAQGFTMGGFEGVRVLPLTWSKSGLPYWATFTHGPRIYDPLQNHFVAIYTRNDTGWQEVSRLELKNPDYLDPTSVTEVQIEPGHLWLEVQGGAGAHAGTYDLLSFDGQTLRSEVAQVSASAGTGRLEDLNGEGSPDVILDQTDYYVFLRSS